MMWGDHQHRLAVIAMKVVHPGKPGQAVGWDTHRFDRRISRMNIHKNARLTLQGRVLLVRRSTEVARPASGCSGEGPLTEPTAAAQHRRRERLKVLRVFGRLPVADSATRSRGRRPKSLRGGSRGGVCAGGGVGLWGLSADVGPGVPVWNRGDG